MVDILLLGPEEAAPLLQSLGPQRLAALMARLGPDAAGQVGVMMSSPCVSSTASFLACSWQV
jgi:flagellar motility protein MotE (MotC chaperone)